MVNLSFFQLRSLKTRVTLFTLTIFVIGIWLFSFYASKKLHEDMQHELGVQQHSITSLLAKQINDELRDRFIGLEIVGQSITQELMNNPSDLLALLSQRPLMQRDFNAGVYVTQLDGVAIASMPTTVKRFGINYIDRDYIRVPLKEGKAKVGQPVIGRAVDGPIIGMAVPIRNYQGKVIGAIAGVIDLNKPSFLDKVTDNRYGKSGYYLLEAQESRLVITSSDKRRIMQMQPAPGVNPLIDRHLKGFEDTGITVNALGVEVLTSANRIPLANWMIVAGLPTNEAFAPIRDLERHILLTTILMTLLAGGMIWWMLKRELSPMFDTVESLSKLASSGQHPKALPVTSQNEIGDLIKGFNGLLQAVWQREDALKESEFRWKFAIEGSGDGLWDWDVENNIVFFSKTWKEMLGYSEEDIGNGVSEWEQRIFAEDKTTTLMHVQSHLDGKTSSYISEYRMRCKDGTYKWILDRGVVVNRNYEGKPLRMIGTHTDISERKRTEENLRIAATAFESQEGLLITDANNIILRVNRTFTQVTGYTAEEVIGKTPKLLSSGQQDSHFYAAMWDSINHIGVWEGEIWNRRKNGQIYPERVAISAVKDSKGVVTNYVASLTDITASKAASEEIHNLAFYDPLTQLPNRRLLLDRLRQALSASARSGKKGAVLFLDLDHFKTLNDTLGHDIGDLLLKQVAERLKECVREGDTVARLGGDEFVVLLEDLGDEAVDAAAHTKLIANKILAFLSQPYQLDSYQTRSSASIGATLFSDHEVEAEELLKQSDIAMYQAKDLGRNALCFFDPQMQEAIAVRVEMENALRQAIELEQFQLYYQVQVDNARNVIGAESLIRWIHPERGIISPFHFIPLAEDTGLIVPMGQWVLDTACAQLKVWQQNDYTKTLSLSVNVSARQFQQIDFVETVQAAVLAHDIDPTLLKLELTESMLLHDITGMISKIMVLKDIGVMFELDDFGTGYSSLQYLKKLPLNQLKIDQSFVRELAENSSDKAIVRTIITMAHSLDLEVIAEGVETEEQLAFLKVNGCNHYQGYLFGKPLPIVAFDAFLKLQ